jgi:hypothetical protein
MRTSRKKFGHEPFLEVSDLVQQLNLRVTTEMAITVLVQFLSFSRLSLDHLKFKNKSGKTIGIQFDTLYKSSMNLLKNLKKSFKPNSLKQGKDLLPLFREGAAEVLSVSSLQGGGWQDTGDPAVPGRVFIGRAPRSKSVSAFECTCHLNFAQ